MLYIKDSNEMNTDELELIKIPRSFSKHFLRRSLMPKQFSVICLDMYALHIFQTVSSNNSLNFSKYSSTGNSGSCVIKRLSLR